MAKKCSSADANKRGTKHPTYVGGRKRKWAMWISEIREQGKEKRIWPCSFPTPEMAARAHDAAAFASRGESAIFNFPAFIHSLPWPATDIRTAAIAAAYSSCQDPAKQEASQQCFNTKSGDNNDGILAPDLLPQNQSQPTNISVTEEENNMILDSLLDWPKMLMNIADGVLIGSSLLFDSAGAMEEDPDDQFTSIWDFTYMTLVLLDKKSMVELSVLEPTSTGKEISKSTFQAYTG